MVPQAVGKALARGAEVGYCQLMEVVQLLQLMEEVVRMLSVCRSSEVRCGPVLTSMQLANHLSPLHTHMGLPQHSTTTHVDISYQWYKTQQLACHAVA